MSAGCTPRFLRSTATLVEESTLGFRCRETLRQEHDDAALQHGDRRDGAVPGRRRGDYHPALRDLRREGAWASPRAQTEIVIMDKMGAHRAKRIRELIEGGGCELLYLPAYSADYNPIEEALLAKIKNLLSKVAARSKEALVEAIGAALFCDHRRRCPGLLRARRLPSSGSATVKRAVRGW